MNEQIQKLWEQSGGSYDRGNQHVYPSCKIDNPQKFAELIVQECVQQLELVRKYRYDRVHPLENQQTIIDECQYQIKQHFGVE